MEGFTAAAERKLDVEHGFECSRLEIALLAQAYQRVVPGVRRRVGPRPSEAQTPPYGSAARAYQRRAVPVADEPIDQPGTLRRWIWHFEFSTIVISCFIYWCFRLASFLYRTDIWHSIEKLQRYLSFLDILDVTFHTSHSN